MELSANGVLQLCSLIWTDRLKQPFDHLVDEFCSETGKKRCGVNVYVTYSAAFICYTCIYCCRQIL